MKAEQRSALKISISFVILFILYHSAEYMIVFKNNVGGFFIFQFLFFISAWILGNWNQKTGLGFWGLSFLKLKTRHFVTGTFLGIILYAIPYIVSLCTGIEILSNVPHWKDILSSSIPFAFGVLFSSFSEDVLTRGTVFRLLENKMDAGWIILLSSLVYVLNHIYRLSDGFETLSYLFLLGIVFMIPLLTTKNLWITGFMHWAGNTFFFVTHTPIQTETTESGLTANYLFSFWMLVLIPVMWFIFRKYQSKPA